jgi:hypothetical protein
MKISSVEVVISMRAKVSGTSHKRFEVGGIQFENLLQSQCNPIGRNFLHTLYAVRSNNIFMSESTKTFNAVKFLFLRHGMNLIIRLSVQSEGEDFMFFHASTWPFFLHACFTLFIREHQNFAYSV